MVPPVALILTAAALAAEPARGHQGETARVPIHLEVAPVGTGFRVTGGRTCPEPKEGTATMTSMLAEHDHAVDIEASVELLRTIADVLDIRSVFPRVSAITQNVLPHHAMAMVFLDEHGRIELQARTSDFPDIGSHVAPIRAGDVKIISDLARDRVPVVRGEDPTDRLLAAGYQSALGVVTRARDQAMYVAFFSNRANAFSPHDIPIACQITDHIVLAVSHEQLAKAARQAAEARVRETPRGAGHVLVDELESTANARVVGNSRVDGGVAGRGAVVPTDTTVLLTGESGTGKEVVARFIHRGSARRTVRLSINCAAFLSSCLESELFGYERGAFTSTAIKARTELAAGGVLFLDEVGEMTLSAQAKFLRLCRSVSFSGSAAPGC